MIKQEELPIGDVYYDIEGYQVCPVSNPEIDIRCAVSCIQQCSGRFHPSRICLRLESTYQHVILREAIIDWLDREGWDYEVSYIADYVFDNRMGKEGPYTTKAYISIYVEDIESAREKIAEQLAGVLQELMSPDRKGVQFKNKRYYEVWLWLKDGSEIETINLIGGSEELDITKEGLIEEFKENRH